MRIEPVFLFDLDGALVDSVYQHVLAWKPALDAEGIELSVWCIHRKTGMSGGLFTNQLLRETEVEIDPEGDRDQQPDGNSSGQPCCARRRSCTNPPVITRDQVRSAKPDPDLFSAAS